MFKAIDHIVIVVAELEAAIRAYADAGFTVVRGGRHNIGTHNALIAFADGAYIELIAFLNPVPNHPWYAALARGNGIVDFCAQTDDLAADVGRLRSSGVSIGDPNPMTRKRPDGFEVKWVLAIPSAPFNGVLPFWIKDETPRDERVPRERTHRNGAAGLKTLTVMVEDAAASARYFGAVVAKSPSPIERVDLNARGFAIEPGPHRIELLTPARSQGPAAERLATAGQGPYEAVLRGSGSPRTFDPAALMGARLRIE
ncbi:MAG TPA: VOC family protein [Candidatus Binataceae bacterium]|nr:VOC family protein [Candidatus Binataceae bacterium]